MSTWSLNRFSQHQFTQSTVELVVELVLVRRTYTKTGHLTLKFLLVAHDSFILNEVRRTMTASILLFQSNEEDLLRKWEYTNLLTFPRAWLWSAPVCTYIYGFPSKNRVFSLLSTPVRFSALAPPMWITLQTPNKDEEQQMTLTENRASHIEVLTRSPRFLYTKWSSKNDDSLNTAFSIERRRLITKMGIHEPPDFPSGLTMVSSRLHIYIRFSI